MTADDPSTMTVPELAAAMYEHLRATEELPIDPTANRWLGEAQAAAADVADGDPPESVLAKRAAQVEHLLENAGETGHPEGQRRVEAAHAAATELTERLGEPKR
jgi:hypothetical protein